MTGDASDTTLALSVTPSNENHVNVYFDGVYQSKSNFSLSGSTITFSTGPPTGVVVEAVSNQAVSVGTATGIAASALTGLSEVTAADADHVLINDGGVLKKITPANLGIGAGGASLAFKTIAVSGQSDVVADSSTDTLTFVAGSNITLTTNASNDSVTIASSASGSAITIKDEGSALSTAASSINFVGAGVTASGTGATKTITISGGGGGGASIGKILAMSHFMG